MLPFHFSTLSPYLRDKTRLFLLHSGENFGIMNDNDHMLRRLNGYVKATQKTEPYQIHQTHQDREFPQLDREPVNDRIVTDLILSDHFRHNRSIESRYRTNQPTYYDLVRIFHPTTRYHHSISRGLERHIVSSIDLLDNEVINRMTIEPLIV